MPINVYMAEAADYQILFNEAVNSDGFFTEEAANKLADEFNKSPESFVSALAKYTDNLDDIELITQLTTDAGYFNNSDEFETNINKLLNENLEENVKNIVSKIKTKTDIIKEDISSPATIPEKKDIKPLPKYSPKKLEKLMSEVTNDDEYKYLINLAFCADPELFVKELSKQSPEKIKDISTNISDTFISKKKIDLGKISKKYSNNSKEASALKTIIESKSENLIDNLPQLEAITLSGQWEIHVLMFVHDYGDRDYIGQGLVLYRPDGTNYWSTETILCRSASGDDPTVTNGNTPSGDYTGELYGPVSPSSSYGPYKLVLTTPVSGQVVDAGRSGIWIHGGNPITDTSKTWYPLRPTYGCVRITNSEQNTLKTKIESLISQGAETVGNVYMYEWD